MKPIVKVAKRDSGKLPTTAVTNELAEAILSLAPEFGGGAFVVPPPGALLEPWLVWDAGPSGEANKTNHQYWLRRAYISNAKASPAVPGDPAKLTESPAVTSNDNWILATNLAERLPNIGGTETAGPHGLPKGQAVGPVWAESDANDPSVTRYVFFFRMGLFPVVLTQTGGSAGNLNTPVSFTYTVDHVNSGGQLATGHAPVWPSRSQNGLKVAATTGFAWYVGSTLNVFAFERDDTTGC